MINKLRLTKSIIINVSKDQVWDAITNPELIKKYFFGTEAISDFVQGSPILYRGVWEGKPYEDKGTILEVKKNELLKHNYWSSFTSTPDAPENYANITYSLAGEDGNVKLSITQDNIATEESKTHSENNWSMVLDGMKKILEENS